MAGIGHRDRKGKTNFLICDTKTRKSELEDAFKEFTTRIDIGVILINQHIAEQIRYLVEQHSATIPTILEIPTKDRPYDPQKDSVMQHVKVFFGGALPDV
eukprot:GHVO01011770.1.p2 GENE.GHVO01011770.1~~GHVO01011770.1.p2  ORF type:complete len:100 (+),score=18.62 GHVO01011770.1:73-372(+)